MARASLEELRRRADDIKARYRCSDAARSRTKLVRRGGEWSGLCPFHDEKTGSFSVNDAKAFMHCFGCSYHADIIKFIRDTHGVGFIEAMDMIDGGAVPPVDPRLMAREREEDRERDEANVADALRFWEDASSVAIGSPADRYLLSREINVRPEASMRFGRIPSWRGEAGQWQGVKPALIFLLSAWDGSFSGIQRIFLTEDGRKAPMRKPKLSLGSIHGSFISFGPMRSEVTVTGGPEDGLTLYEEHNGYVTVLVSCGESMLPFLRFSRVVNTVTIARQNDKPGEAAAKRSDRAYREQGRVVRHIAPEPWFKDWNDRKRGIRIAQPIPGPSPIC